MYPMSFYEFLKAIEDRALPEFESISLTTLKPIPTVIHQHLLSRWREYLVVGGLPEVVATYVAMKNASALERFNAVREKQYALVEGYRSDFSKHSGTVNANHIEHVFTAVPQQLSTSLDTSAKRFQFAGIIPQQARFRNLRDPIGWLKKARLVIPTLIANSGEQALRAHIAENRFKLYLFDIGLLHAMLQVPFAQALHDELGSYKGFIVENFVAQELLHGNEDDLIAWQQGESEVEFLSHGPLGDVIPIEVKSSERSRKAKSLESFITRYKPTQAYKLTAQNVGVTPGKVTTTLPLYLARLLRSHG